MPRTSDSVKRPDAVAFRIAHACCRGLIFLKPLMALMVFSGGLATNRRNHLI
jgi:hypothetical protein